VRDSSLRARVELFSALIFVLGGAALAMLTALRIVDVVAPQLNAPHAPSPLELLIVLPSALAILSLGLVAGSVALILVWAPFSTQRQLERFAQPDIRPFSTFLRWFVRRLYR
jgi:hypothetical protein